MLNRAQLIGNTGGDPEVKALGNGGKVANFSLATNESYKDKDGVKQEKTEWHRIVCFGNVAEIVEKYLSKGKRVFIEGKIQTREWEDKTGAKKYTTEIVAQTVRMLDRKEGGNGAGENETSTGSAKKDTPNTASTVVNKDEKKPQPAFLDKDDSDDLPF
jgi:single-strand DNA-binding protein